MRNRKIWIWLCALCASALLGCAGGQKAVTDAATGTSAGKQVTSSAGTTDRTGTSGGSAGSAGAAVADSEVQGDVIAVTIAASKDLNTFNNQPHTLVLVVYQLSQSSVFSQFLDTPEGKAKLLAGESFDATVLSRRRLVVQPGETQRVVLDRVEGARYLAAVAGFYNIQSQDMSRLLPVVRETTGMLSWKKPKPQMVRFTLGKSGFAQ